MIVSVSGKMGSGKDTVGCITSMLVEGFQTATIARVISSGARPFYGYGNRKFADKLKDIVCMLISCTREQLEDQKFKETPIGVDWNKWVLFYTDKYSLDGYTKTFIVEGEAEAYIETQNCVFTAEIEKVELTPRLLLQLLGTECGRNIIHPNIWINSLMSEYTEDKEWVITDTRFPNELEAIEKVCGITIRVVRLHGYTNPDTGEYKEVPINYHSSETALDDAKFDYVINNNGTIEDLIESVRVILKNENLI